MSSNPPATPEEIALQLARHVESLRAAGVEWAPGAPPADAAPPAPPRLAVTGASLSVVQPSLFAAAPLPPAAGDSPEARLAQLEALRQQVAGCTRCPQLASTRTQTVFGVGPIDPELCFVGEAPGADEDRQGEPFVGAAGQLLTRIIAACGMKREEVFITNIIRCRPPGNRPPEPQEAENCSEWLHKTLELVRPKFICSLGNTPLRHLLGLSVGITKARGRFYEWRGIPVLATFHPSYLLRSPEKKKEVWEDMKLLLARMGRPVPGK
jgi:uracil-DNA glycosylase family 4